MNENCYKKHLIVWDNSEVIIEKYTYSPAISVEFSSVSSTNYSTGTYKGSSQFRIDYTKVGRYECEFLDHSFSYRGENEITVLTTNQSGEWVVSASIATKTYQGCSLIIEYDKVNHHDKELLKRFGLSIKSLTTSFNNESKWYKISDNAKYEAIFSEMQQANALQHSELILVKALELLVLLSLENSASLKFPERTTYLPSKRVNVIKEVHDFVLRHYDTPISFENLAAKHHISYSMFNSSFKMIYGDTPYQYLKKLRMNIAAEKLNHTTLSIAEIAMSVGYTNASKFATAFKSIHKVLPKEFRKIK